MATWPVASAPTALAWACAVSMLPKPLKNALSSTATTADQKTGLIITLACETDFVSKNAEFVAVAQSIMDVAIKNNVKSLDELQTFQTGKCNCI